MRLGNGKKWYVSQLNDYTPDFLQEIIMDLVEDKEEHAKKGQFDNE